MSRFVNKETSLNRHVCKWRKPSEMNVDGSYIMTRTDYDQKNQFLVTITNGRIFDEPEPPIRDFDPECRFFGPIPDCME